MKAKSRVGGRRKRSSELLCGGSHLGSGSKRSPVSNPGIIYYKPVSGPRGEAPQGNRITSAVRYTQAMCIRIVSLPALSRSGKFDANRTPSA